MSRALQEVIRTEGGADPAKRLSIHLELSPGSRKQLIKSKSVCRQRIFTDYGFRKARLPDHLFFSMATFHYNNRNRGYVQYEYEAGLSLSL